MNKIKGGQGGGT